MKKHIFAAIAAISMMGAFSGTANAVWTNNGTPATTANQLAVKTGITVGIPTYTIATVPAGTVITVALTGGATFTNAPTLALGTALGTLTPIQAVAGSSSATFLASITTAGTLTLNDVIAPNGIDIDGTAVAANGLVDITITAANAGVTLIPTDSMDATGVFLPAITFVNATTTTVTTAGTETADVATGFTSFVGVVTLGVIDIANPTGAPIIVGTDPALITLTGDFTGIQSVTVAGFGGGVITSATAAGAAPAAGTIANEFFIDAVAGKAYAVNTASLGPGGAGTNTLTLTFVADGANAIVGGPYTAAVDFLAAPAGATLSAHNSATGLTANTITRNGATFVSDNISPTSTIRIADHGATTAVAGVITVTAFDAAGVAVTQVGATLPASILGGHTVTIAKGVLRSAFPTATRFVINVESSNVAITHFKANATGLNVIVGTVGNGTTIQL